MKNNDKWFKFKLKNIFPNTKMVSNICLPNARKNFNKFSPQDAFFFSSNSFHKDFCKNAKKLSFKIAFK